MRKRTSSGLRDQFSVEKAYADNCFTPSSMQPQTVSIRTASPRLCPSVRAIPRSFAQRPLPSITRATWFGTSSAGISGGVAPEGCGSGGRTATDAGGVFDLPRRSPGTVDLLSPAARAGLCGACRSIMGSDRSCRPTCHCRCAAASPFACLRTRSVVVSANAKSARASAAIRSSTPWLGTADPGGRQCTHTAPPAAT